MLSFHLRSSLPLDRFPVLGLHSVHLFVHLLSLIISMCPAHFHFCWSINLGKSVTLVFCLIYVCLIWSCIFMPITFLSIALSVVFQRFKMFLHTLRKPATNITKQAFDWNPQGKRTVGRPRQTWRRSIDTEMRASGVVWAELRRIFQDHVRCRIAVVALCSPRN